MTAEVAIMNKRGIALAADSAVTVGTINGQKIYNSANKLFALSKYQPVGIMIYGNAEFMGIPWETIIKQYRKKLKEDHFPNLVDYGNDFIKFIETEELIQSNMNEAEYIEECIFVYFQKIAKDIYKAIQKNIAQNGKISSDETKCILKDIIDKHYVKWSNYKLLSTFPDDYVGTFILNHKELIKKSIDMVFKKLPLNKGLINKLNKISAYLFCKDCFRNSKSGIVIAGFGSNELFPSIISFDIECLIDKKLKYIINKEATQRISENNQGLIIPFAQSEMVCTFMEGIDPSLDSLSDNYIRKIFEEYPKMILDRIQLKDGPKKLELQKKLDQASNDFYKDYKEIIGEYKSQNHIIPVLKAVTILPKDELAAMAESLVNLTSFKRKVTLDAETVGGPIDVAVISKGDGFIWIKRKHYFKPELNRLFIGNYFREVNEENEKEHE